MRSLAIFVLIVGLWSCVYSRSQVDEQYRQFILNWEAPLDLPERFPYYLTGRDKEGSPVWIFPLGSWDTRSYLEQYPKKASTLRRYSEQMFTRFHESPRIYGGGYEGGYGDGWGGYNQSPSSDGYIIIADLDQYGIRSVTHLGALRVVFDTAIQFSRLNNEEQRIKRVYVVNANLVFRAVYQLLRPILGRLGSLIELHGTNRDRWVPILLRQIPQDQLPVRLGGSPYHKSIQIFG